MKTIRPGWGPSAVIWCAVLLGTLIAWAVIQPDQVLWVLATAVGVAVVGGARIRAVGWRSPRAWCGPSRTGSCLRIR